MGPVMSEHSEHTDGLYYSPLVGEHAIKVMHESGR
jgi:hypothetical protein